MKKAIVEYIPVGLQNLGGWFFVSFLCVLFGLSVALGFAEPSTILTILHPIGLKIWGTFLVTAGSIHIGGILSNKPALEKMGLHFLTIAMVVYGAWILVAVPFVKTGITIYLIIALASLAQIRCLVLRRLINRPPLRRYLFDQNEE